MFEVTLAVRNRRGSNSGVLNGAGSSQAIPTILPRDLPNQRFSNTIGVKKLLGGLSKMQNLPLFPIPILILM